MVKLGNQNTIGVAEDGSRKIGYGRLDDVRRVAECRGGLNDSVDTRKIEHTIQMK